MIGILGGTFDPVHHGHLRTALEVAEHFGIRDMRLIPGKIPPHRPQPLAASEHRLGMLQAAVASEPSLQVDEREFRRSGNSYTVETLESFRAEFGGEFPLFFALGFDAFQQFRCWHRWETILQLAHLVVVHRPGYSLPPNEWYENRLQTDPMALCEAPAGHIYSLAVTALDISATDVRQLLEGGKNPRYLLPDAVLDYIESKQLYRET